MPLSLKCNGEKSAIIHNNFQSLLKYLSEIYICSRENKTSKN